MRLTLRTMLCYLDDVLEPADAAVLGKKIEESEYASQVVHRIRTSMRRLRLGAPKVAGDGFDPNTVADYLDNTLPAEKVPDFERVCLDPDTEMQLAEVAACHQILTLVLGEPAEVPQSMRQRIYDLPHSGLTAGGVAHKSNGVAHAEPQTLAAAPEAETALAAEAATAQSEAPAAVSEPPQTEPRRVDEAEARRRERQKPEVPAYLKEGSSKRSLWPAFLALVLVGVLIAGIAYTVGNPNKPQVAVVPPKANDDKLFEDEDRPATSGHKVTDNNGSASATKIAPADKEPVAIATGETDNADTAADTGDDIGETALDNSPDDLVADEPIGPGEGATATPPATETTPGEGESVASVAPSDADLAPPTDVEGETGGAALPLVDKVIGHYISNGEVLVAHDGKADSWNRLASRAGVRPGMHMRSLPTFRPQVLLDNAVQITLSGDTEVIVGNPTDDGTPFLNIPFGRVMIATMSKAGNAVVLRAGEREAMLTMVNADAAVALEVARFHVPGVDPAREPAHEQTTLFVTSGQVQWLDAEGKTTTLDAGQQLQFIDDGAGNVASAAESPKWLRSSDISDIDRRASATLEPLLADVGPIEIKLEELAEDQRVEVRSLAMRSLASLDRYERILEAFKDESLKSYWSQHLDQLQSSLAHGAPTAAEVHAAAVRASGDNGDALYRALWGYSPEQLKAGDAKRLVDMLKHPSLEFRVLAINTLRGITGKTQGYHPHLPEARRRTAERQWDQSLTSGEVTYATPPVSLPSRKPREIP